MFLLLSFPAPFLYSFTFLSTPHPPQLCISLCALLLPASFPVQSNFSSLTPVGPLPLSVCSSSSSSSLFILSRQFSPYHYYAPDLSCYVSTSSNTFPSLPPRLTPLLIIQTYYFLPAPFLSFPPPFSILAPSISPPLSAHIIILTNSPSHCVSLFSPSPLNA